MSWVGQGGVRTIAAGKRNNNKSENSLPASFLAGVCVCVNLTKCAQKLLRSE